MSVQDPYLCLNNIRWLKGFYSMQFRKVGGLFALTLETYDTFPLRYLQSLYSLKTSTRAATAAGKSPQQSDP